MSINHRLNDEMIGDVGCRSYFPFYCKELEMKNCVSL